MSEKCIKAVLVVGHGSRREEANEDVRQAALRIGEIESLTSQRFSKRESNIGMRLSNSTPHNGWALRMNA